MIKLPETRKAYACKSCGHTMFDHCVTSCDCMPDKNEFDEDDLCTIEAAKQAIKDALEKAAHIADCIPFDAGIEIRKLKDQL